MENNFIPGSWAPRLQDVSAFMGAPVQMLRLDEIHPVVSGNKWFKLKENIAAARLIGKRHLVTFGGAYSNHLIATAAAAKAFGMASTGIVRGEPAYAANPTLSACLAYGMQLRFVSRAAYRQKEEAGFLDALGIAMSGSHVIPEGGANDAGRRGAAVIAQWVLPPATHVAVSVGTGTTLAGILSAISQDIVVLGFCAAKNMDEPLRQVLQGLSGRSSFSVAYDHLFGGFGKWNDTLIHFMKEFYAATGIPLDVVYTGKMMYALRQDILNNRPAGERNIICIHTGGVQGNPAGLFGV